tara:strand:- start:1228 stop:1464 length:237 start_codon:yes stop_codon:yes gene_type:complete
MTELTNGMYNTVKKLAGTSSLTLAIIFFIGHILIAMTVVSLMTGASVWEAGAVALVEPAINSIWFYVLHKAWSKFNNA